MVSRIRNIAVVQYAIVSGLLYAIIGLIAAVFYLLFGGMMSAVMPGIRGGFGFASIVVFPILYFVGGFIFGMVFAVLYNLVAGWTGGVEITLEATPSPTIQQPYSPT
ncbi:MAG: hypothetical protein ACXWNK_02800 [Vulcanimicrobiaceae bacterium]